jgi:hypothetical protein
MPRNFTPQLEELGPRMLLSATHHVQPLLDAATSGYTVAQIRHAYGFDRVGLDGSGQKIVIVGVGLPPPTSPRT